MGDAYSEAGSRYNLLLVSGRLLLSGEISRESFDSLVREALEAAGRSGNRGAESAVHLLLAQDPAAPVEAKIGSLETALELNRGTGEVRERGFALRLLADQLMSQDPEANRDRALEILDEAIALARSGRNLNDLARAHVIRAGVGRSTGRREEALADYLAAIETVETMRDMQRDELVRARFLWSWTFLYYRTAGYLLEPVGQRPAPEDAERAFAIVERLRSRLFLDLLDAAHAAEAVAAASADRQEHGAMLDRIAEVQRTLHSPGLLDEEETAARSELARLEALEAELRDRLARDEPSYALLRRPDLASVEDLQGLLAPDQALLAFQLSTREIDETTWYWNGGSWVFLITREGVEIVPLPDRPVIEERVAVFQGLLERRDELEREAAGRLYEDLLSEALAALPPGITRLVLVPDGVLHRLSFGALRETPDAEPLAARYELGAAPSATLWHHWRSSGPGGAGSSALALADPLLETSGAEPGEERSARAGIEDALGPLPRARSEARALVRRLGGDSRLLAGAEASEGFVKSADLGRYGVLHFAAHALVDDARPQRSAVVLAPGGPEEDGLLQMRDVVTLDLDGQVVILSACSSASGELTAGEGVLGLARAFFQAGARVVVGSLWPLRDDEAAGLVEDLAEGLGRGQSVGAALAEVRRRRIAEGAPTAAWAGLVVLGDADLVPLPGGRPSRPWAWLLATGALAFLALLVLSFRRSSRRS
jgi:CHAT domain-containing protein